MVISIHHYLLPTCACTLFIFPTSCQPLFSVIDNYLSLVNHARAHMDVEVFSGHEQPTNDQVLTGEWLSQLHNHQLLITGVPMTRPRGPSPIYAVILTGLILCRLWVGKHSCCEVICIIIMPGPIHLMYNLVFLHP